MLNAQKLWKTNLNSARQHHRDWWDRKAMVFWITAPASRPHEAIAEPKKPDNLKDRWFDPVWRARIAEYRNSRTYFGGDAFPIGGTLCAASDLALYLGSGYELAETTIWVMPGIDDPDAFPPICVNRQSEGWKLHTAMVDEMLRVSRGRFLVAMPDLIENLDILSSMRGTENLMMDMIERPEWVEGRLREINQAYFEAFDYFYEKTKDDMGGNTFVFNIWGPGKTAKVQCDSASMFGPEMFRQFVAPVMAEQCRWLDYSLFHFDGESALPNLDAVLEIEPLKAVEWTPQYISQGDTGGMPKFHDLYKRILKAGKSVQAIAVKPAEVIPLLDACGPNGMFIMCDAASEDEARALEEKVNAYR